MLSSLRVRLRDLSAEFKSRLNVLLGDLAYQPDVDMRFLGVVMNFNDVYEPVRRRRAPAASGTGSRDKDKEREREKEKERERERARRKAAAAAEGSAQKGERRERKEEMGGG